MIAIPNGDTPTGMVAVVMFVRVEMTDTVPVMLATYALESSGVTATATGPIPTPGLAITARSRMSMTETLCALPLAT